MVIRRHVSWRRLRTAIIEKQHTLGKPLRNGTGGIVSAKYEEKATVDFMGRYGKRPIAFEAKHCATESASSRCSPSCYPHSLSTTAR